MDNKIKQLFFVSVCPDLSQSEGSGGHMLVGSGLSGADRGMGLHRGRELC